MIYALKSNFPIVYNGNPLLPKFSEADAGRSLFIIYFFCSNFNRNSFSKHHIFNINLLDANFKFSPTVYPGTVGKILADPIDPTFGMMMGQNDSISPGVFEIDLGINNFEDANQILSINDKKYLDYWYSENANKISGIDGGQMMTHPMVDPSQNLTFYFNEIYRCINMTYEGSNSKIHGIKTHNFHFVPEIFNYSYPLNHGYCKNNLKQNKLKLQI